jgi:hypothetical protein
MTSTRKVPKKITAILAIVFLLPALYIFGLWINVFRQDLTPAQIISEFTGHFPSFMNNYKMIIYLSMTFCIIAIALAANSFRQRLVSLRLAMLFTVMIASLIFFVNVFQLI